MINKFKKSFHASLLGGTVALSCSFGYAFATTSISIKNVNPQELKQVKFKNKGTNAWCDGSGCVGVLQPLNGLQKGLLVHEQ